MLVSDAISIYLAAIQDFTKATQRLAAQRLSLFARWCEEQHLELEAFTDKQIAALFKACENEIDDRLVYRDKAIIALLVDTGIRASELVGLTLENVHLEYYNPFLKVNGKGRKEREDVYMLSRLLGHDQVATTEVYLKAVRAQDVRRSKGIESVLDRLKVK
jgi:site-specific recombinase XerD